MGLGCFGLILGCLVVCGGSFASVSWMLVVTGVCFAEDAAVELWVYCGLRFFPGVPLRV